MMYILGSNGYVVVDTGMFLLILSLLEFGWVVFRNEDSLNRTF